MGNFLFCCQFSLDGFEAWLSLHRTRLAIRFHSLWHFDRGYCQILRSNWRHSKTQHISITCVNTYRFQIFRIWLWRKPHLIASDIKYTTKCIKQISSRAYNLAVFKFCSFMQCNKPRVAALVFDQKTVYNFSCCHKYLLTLQKLRRIHARTWSYVILNSWDTYLAVYNICIRMTGSTSLISNVLN